MTESHIRFLVKRKTTILLVSTFLIAAAAKVAHPIGSTFFDGLDSYNTARWSKSDGWTNGKEFNVGWRADHINLANSIMTLKLDNMPCPSGCSGKPYASGEYRTTNYYGYGKFEARFKAAKASGVVTSFFTYTGPTDGTQWHEIDVEILGKDTTKMQTNYITNGISGHETSINLGFDASVKYHKYAFEWSSSSIKWYVDDKLVHTETGSRGPLPRIPGKIMVNLWPGINVNSWLGPFTYSGSPLYAQYDWLQYSKY